MLNLVYYNKILSPKILHHRDLYLMYMEDPRLLTDEQKMKALMVITSALLDEPVICRTEEEYEILIELYILDHPHTPRANQYTNKDDQTIRDMKKDGATTQEIADAIGRTTGGISCRWSYLNDKNNQ